MVSNETREDFMQSMYDMFSGDGNNDRANQIIDIFDIATENCIELPFPVGSIVYVTLEDDNLFYPAKLYGMSETGAYLVLVQTGSQEHTYAWFCKIYSKDEVTKLNGTVKL